MKPAVAPTALGSLVVLLAALAGFELALAAGAPLGAAAWGGERAGALPPGLRVASAVSGIAWGALAAALAAGRPRGATGSRVLLRSTAVVAGIGVILNLLSSSGPERTVWAPVSAAIAVLAWRIDRTRKTLPTEASASSAGTHRP